MAFRYPKCNWDGKLAQKRLDLANCRGPATPQTYFTAAGPELLLAMARSPSGIRCLVGLEGRVIEIAKPSSAVSPVRYAICRLTEFCDKCGHVSFTQKSGPRGVTLSSVGNPKGQAKGQQERGFGMRTLHMDSRCNVRAWRPCSS